jgi:predicted cupin superfamily sugar epimerase
VGGGEICLPKREIRGYYKDFLTGETKVQIGESEHEVRESLTEIKYLMETRDDRRA